MVRDWAGFDSVPLRPLPTAYDFRKVVAVMGVVTTLLRPGSPASIGPHWAGRSDDWPGLTRASTIPRILRFVCRRDIPHDSTRCIFRGIPP